MRKAICLIMVAMWILSVAPVQALDLSIPDGLKGEVQVADATAQRRWRDRYDPSRTFVTQDEMDAAFAEEKDKRNDTLALIAWGLIGLIAIHQANDHNGGGGGEDPSPPPCR